MERDLKRESNGQEPSSISLVPMSASQSMDLAKQQCIEPDNMSSGALHLQQQQQGLVTPPRNHYSPPMKSDLKAFDSLLHNSPEMMYSESMLPSYNNNMNNFGTPSPEANYYQQLEHYSNFENFDSFDRTKSFDRTFEHQFSNTPYQIPLRRASVAGGEKLHTCSFGNCGKQFKRQEHLKRHVRSHTGEKPYVCSVPGCERSFARSDHLHQHSRTHDVQKSPQSGLFGQLLNYGLDRLSNENNTSPLLQNVNDQQQGAHHEMDMSDLLALDQDMFHQQQYVSTV